MSSAAVDISPIPDGAGRRAASWGPVGLVVTGALSVQFGAAVAALLFPHAGVAGVVTLRLVVAALLMLALVRPRLRGHDLRSWFTVVGFGAAMALMNVMLYQAVARIPLGIAVTIEVLGPLALSVVLARSWRSWLWAGLALAGVFVLGGGALTSDLDLTGLLFAAGAASMWAAYILGSAAVGRRFRGADGLALAIGVSALLTLPWGIASSGTAMLQPHVLLLGAAVALLSSALPYTLELFALRRIPTSTFAVMTSLGPVMAAGVGYLVLGQTLTLLQVAAVGLVVLAGVGAVRGTASG